MISIKNEKEIKYLEIAGEIVGNTHKHLQKFIKPGITTNELDQIALEFILKVKQLHHLKIMKDIQKVYVLQ